MKTFGDSQDGSKSRVTEVSYQNHVCFENAVNTTILKRVTRKCSAPVRLHLHLQILNISHKRVRSKL